MNGTYSAEEEAAMKEAEAAASASAPRMQIPIDHSQSTPDVRPQPRIPVLVKRQSSLPARSCTDDSSDTDSSFTDSEEDEPSPSIPSGMFEEPRNETQHLDLHTAESAGGGWGARNAQDDVWAATGAQGDVWAAKNDQAGAWVARSGQHDTWAAQTVQNQRELLTQAGGTQHKLQPVQPEPEPELDNSNLSRSQKKRVRQKERKEQERLAAEQLAAEAQLEAQKQETIPQKPRGASRFFSEVPEKQAHEQARVDPQTLNSFPEQAQSASFPQPKQKPSVEQLLEQLEVPAWLLLLVCASIVLLQTLCLRDSARVPEGISLPGLLSYGLAV